MVDKILILLEIMSVIVWIHCLYERKIKFDIAVMVLVLGCLIAYDLTKAYEVSFCYPVIVYVLIIVYCVWRYKDSIIIAAISMSLMMLIISVMQFFFMLVIDIFIGLKEDARVLFANVFVLITCSVFLPKRKIYQIRTYIKNRDRFLWLLLSFPVCMILFFQIQQMKFGQIQLLLFVLSMPILALFLLMSVKWLQERNEKSDIADELQVTKSMQQQYDELIKTIRLRQHEFKNHLAAILATHYTYKSYDKLVRAQAKYCDSVSQENKFTGLLILGDVVLAGFLYEKFCEIEENGIEVKFSIKGKLGESIVPSHHLVEMTGILLDNAFQAIQGKEDNKVVQFHFLEDWENYYFNIANPFPYVGYDEMESWFQMGKSTKGKGHGLGLHRIRCLCEEWNCDIACGNKEIDGKNWIEFELRAGKADRR